MEGGPKEPTKDARPPNKGRCWVSPSLRLSSALSLFLYFLLFINLSFLLLLLLLRFLFLFLFFFGKREVVATDAGPPTHFHPNMFQFSTSFSIVSHFSLSSVHHWMQLCHLASLLLLIASPSLDALNGLISSTKQPNHSHSNIPIQCSCSTQIPPKQHHYSFLIITKKTPINKTSLEKK